MTTINPHPPYHVGRTDYYYYYYLIRTIVYPTIDFVSSILEPDTKPNIFCYESQHKIPEEQEDNGKITEAQRDHPSR